MITQSQNVRLISPRQTLLGATGNALENLITDLYITGTICFVVAENAFYRFNKTSTAAVSVPDVIATSRGAGVPGRWFKMGGDGETIYPLSNVYFIDAGTTTPLGEQDGKITSPFATLAQFMAVPGNKVGYFTPSEVSYGAITLNDGSVVAIIGMSLTNQPPVIFDNVDVTNLSSLSLQNVRLADITIDTSDLRIQSSDYDSLTNSDGNVEIDLITLGDSRQGAAAPPTGNIFVLDSPTETVDFAVPAILAGGTAEVSVLVTNARPGDTFALAPRDDESQWPATCIVGQPRCEVSGTLIVPLIAGTGGVSASTCAMVVTTFPVATT